MSTKYTAFRCPEDVLEAAKRLAKAQRRSLSNYIICLLEEHVAAAEEIEGSAKPAPAKAKRK